VITWRDVHYSHRADQGSIIYWDWVVMKVYNRRLRSQTWCNFTSSLTPNYNWSIFVSGLALLLLHHISPQRHGPRPHHHKTRAMGFHPIRRRTSRPSMTVRSQHPGPVFFDIAPSSNNKLSMWVFGLLQIFASAAGIVRRSYHALFTPAPGPLSCAKAVTP